MCFSTIFDNQNSWGLTLAWKKRKKCRSHKTNFISNTKTYYIRYLFELTDICSENKRKKLKIFILATYKLSKKIITFFSIDWD